MKRKITLIIGLPASGKSHLLNSMSADVKIDDPKIDVIFPEFKEHMIIADSAFCNDHTLQNAIKLLNSKYENIEMTFIYFENNPVQCLINAKNRTNKIVDNYIKHLTKNYNPINPIPVWR